MKNRLQNEPEEIIKYMDQWVDQEDWSDLQCMLNAAIVGCPDALEHAADYLAGTGCINPSMCYEWGKTLEEDILLLAKRFKKLSKKRKDLVYDRIFDEVLFIDCHECNHVCFVHDGNEQIYPELRHKCWKCDAEHITIKRYKAKNKNTGTGSYQKESA